MICSVWAEASHARPKAKMVGSMNMFASVCSPVGHAGTPLIFVTEAILAVILLHVKFNL